MNNCIGDMKLNMNEQAIATLTMLSSREPDFAEYDGSQYLVDIQTHTWYNGRERGFVISMVDWGSKESKSRVIHIAVYEHRNSDCLCAVKWTSDNMYLNAPTIDDVPEEAFPNKYAVSKEVYYGQIGEMVQWIYDTLEEHYQTHKREVVSK